MSKLNIIHFVCHDLGRHLGCYGLPVKSPNLDNFAKNGIKFTNAFCNAPACSPSRACAMTGKYSHNNGQIGLAHMGWPLPENEKTIVDYLNENGYETVHTGLSHERHPGENHYQFDFENHWDDWDSKNAVDKAIEYLKNKKENKPFYLNVGTREVHMSVWGRDPQQYKDIKINEDEVFIPFYSPNFKILRKEFLKFQKAILYLDMHFQRLVDAVDKMKFKDDTVIIFTTDHGIANNRSKGTLYDRGVETTLLIRMPEKEYNSREINYLIQNIDIAPTILDIAGIDIPSDIQGKSFFPLLMRKEYQPHKEIFIERNFHGERTMYGSKDHEDVYDPIRAIRTEKFHYIRYFRPEIKKSPWLPYELKEEQCQDTSLGLETIYPSLTNLRKEEELFDVENDPQEFINLAERSEYKKIKEELKTKLFNWMKETNDFVLKGIVPKPHGEKGFGKFDKL